MTNYIRTFRTSPKRFDIKFVLVPNEPRIAKCLTFRVYFTSEINFINVAMEFESSTVKARSGDVTQISAGWTATDKIYVKAIGEIVNRRATRFARGKLDRSADRKISGVPWSEGRSPAEISRDCLIERSRGYVDVCVLLGAYRADSMQLLIPRSRSISLLKTRSAIHLNFFCTYVYIYICIHVCMYVCGSIRTNYRNSGVLALIQTVTGPAAFLAPFAGERFLDAEAQRHERPARRININYTSRSSCRDRAAVQTPRTDNSIEHDRRSISGAAFARPRAIRALTIARHESTIFLPSLYCYL